MIFRKEGCKVDSCVQDGTLDKLVKDVGTACKPGHKRCNLCSEEKANDDFSTTSKGRSSYCACCERLVRRGHSKGLQMETMRNAFKDGTIHTVRLQSVPLWSVDKRRRRHDASQGTRLHAHARRQ